MLLSVCSFLKYKDQDESSSRDVENAISHFRSHQSFYSFLKCRSNLICSPFCQLYCNSEILYGFMISYQCPKDVTSAYEFGTFLILLLKFS